MIYVMIEEYGVVLVAIAVIVGMYCILSAFMKGKKEINKVKTLQDAVNNFKKNHNCQKVDGVQIDDLVNSYIKMVAKYGINSDEAKAVLFGLTNPTIQNIYGEFLDEFNHRVEVVNKTWSEMSKK